MKQIGFAARHVFLGLLATVGTARAHHSTAAFDMQKEGHITGRVEKFEWTNPHAYIYLSVPGPGGKTEQWRIEAGSPSVMRPKGWSADSLKSGDAVTIDYRPARDPGRHQGLVSAVQVGSRQLVGVYAAPRTAVQAQALPTASGLAGVWVPVPTPGPQQRLREHPDSLPLTPAGRRSVAAFHESSASNPAVSCQAPTAPVLMIVPEIKQIEVSPTRVTIRSQGFVADRVIPIGNAPAGRREPSLQGNSMGHWEGARLVVETTEFSPNRVGNAIGVQSGKGKHLVESFELNEARTQLVYRFTLTDPQFLSEPVAEEQPWNYRPDLHYSQDPCDAQSAKRFLN